MCAFICVNCLHRLFYREVTDGGNRNPVRKLYVFRLSWAQRGTTCVPSAGKLLCTEGQESPGPPPGSSLAGTRLTAPSCCSRTPWVAKLALYSWSPTSPDQLWAPVSLPLQEGCSRAKQHPGLVQTLKPGQCHQQETARAPLAAEPLVKTKQQDRIRKQEAQGSDCMAFKNQRSVMCLAPVGSGGLLFTLTPAFFQKGTHRDQLENSCRGHSCPSEKGTSPTMRHAMQRKWTSRWR